MTDTRDEGRTERLRKIAQRPLRRDDGHRCEYRVACEAILQSPFIHRSTPGETPTGGES